MFNNYRAYTYISATRNRFSTEIPLSPKILNCWKRLKNECVTPSYIPKKNESPSPHKNLCTNVHSALFITAKKWKQFKRPSADEWMNKMWCIHIIKYYLAIKRNERVIYARTWMDLDNIKLNKRSQLQKITYRMIPFILNVQKRQIHTSERSRYGESR